MKTKREQKMTKAGEKGNALIYVLIAVALFAALGFTLMNQSRNEGTEELDDAKAELYATQLISYAAQAKSVLDQMYYSGTGVGEYVFLAPDDTGFNTAPHIHKVFHPAGGGLLKGSLPAAVVDQLSSTPAAGWYMGRFNNVEWTDTTGTDIILTAYQISQAVCSKINENITGSASIPSITNNAKTYLIDGAEFSGTNSDLDTTACASCEGYMSLCVKDAGNIYSFYTVLADR